MSLGVDEQTATEDACRIEHVIRPGSLKRSNVICTMNCRKINNDKENAAGVLFSPTSVSSFRPKVFHFFAGAFRVFFLQHKSIRSASQFHGIRRILRVFKQGCRCIDRNRNLILYFVTFRSHPAEITPYGLSTEPFINSSVPGCGFSRMC